MHVIAQNLCLSKYSCGSPNEIFLNAEFVVIRVEIPHCRPAAASAKKNTEVQMRLTSRLLQYRPMSEIQTVCPFNIYMDALSVHSKGASA